MDYKTAIVFISRKPSDYLKSFVKNLKIDNYIVSSSPSTGTNTFYINKAEIFRYHDISYFIERNSEREDYLNTNKAREQRLELTKSLISTRNITKLQEYDYLYFIEDDIYIRSQEILMEFILHHNYNMEDLMLIDNIQYIEQEWLDWWEPFIKEDNFFDGYILKSFSPIIRMSKRMLVSLYAFFDKTNKIYFQEVMFPTLAKHMGYTICGFDCLKFNMSMKNFSPDHDLISLPKAISSKYDFIHTVKEGGIL